MAVTKTIENSNAGMDKIRISRETVASLAARSHPVIDQSYFTKQASLNHSEGCSIIVLEIVRSRSETVNLMFLDEGTHLKCCNRLVELNPELVKRICRKLFSFTSAQFVVLEDIVIDSTTGIDQAHLKFTNQENWCRDISPEMDVVSSKAASGLRRKFRRLQDHVGDSPLRFEFRRSTSADIDAVIAMNAATLAQQGRNHQFEDKKQQEFKSVCNEIGYIAGLYAGEKLIAADIVTVCGGEANFNVVGYDLDFAKYSPGAQVHVMAMAECAAIGCNKANFLWGNSRWKSDMGGTRVPVSTVFVGRGKSMYFSYSLWGCMVPYMKQKARMMVKTMIGGIRPPKFKLRTRVNSNGPALPAE